MKQTVRNTLLAVLTFSCIVAALRGSGLTVPSGTWQPMGNLSAARAGASAALLQDGRILVTGGTGTSGAVPSADFFNPDGTVSPAPAMFNARVGHVSVTLQDGRVLVAGGVSAGGSAASTAEIFDPVANSWTFIGAGMTEARSGATAALLQDGRVLIAGGQNGTLISSTAEIFDPSTGTFTYAGMLSSPRTQHAMTVLHDGRVLIVGGSNGTAPVASTDIFDPVAGTISAGPVLSVARFGHSATTLINGIVAVIGGNNGNADPTQADVAPTEIFDPSAATPAFTTVSASLATPREGHLAIALPNNGGVLIVGGTSAGAAVASAELFTPQVSSTGAWTYSFAPAGAMSTVRSAAAGSANQVNAPSTTMQRNGIVEVAGGNDATGNALNTTEAYGYATVQTDQSDYAPGTTVTITGSGFQPGETVNLQLVESPLIDAPGPFSAIADANGNIANTQFVPDAYDVNVRFYLTATGATSGFTAQNTFTDAGPKPSSTISFPVSGGSYNSTGWSTISGTATFASGTTGRTVSVSIERNGSTNKCWNGTGFTASCPSFSAASGTASWTFAFPFNNFPADDSYTVQSQASDSNGTETGMTSVTFTRDTIAPGAPSKPSLASGNDTGTSQSDDITDVTTNLNFNGTAEANSKVNLFVDGSGTSSGSGTTNNGGNWNNISVATTLTEGTHTVTANATDQAGNVSSLSLPLTITIDITPPTATITSNPTNPSNSTSASFSFTGSDPVSGGVSSGVDHFLCKLDAGAFATCTSPKAYTSLTAGSHTFQVEAVDVAGNTGTPASYTWSVVLDSTPPIVTVSFPAPVHGTNGWFNGQDTVPVVGSVTATDPSNVASITCTDTAGGLTQGALSGSGTGTASRSLAVSGDGTHNISCAATDGVGNAGAASGSTNTTALKIDTQAPSGVAGTATRSPDFNGWYTSAVTVNFSGTDATSGMGSCTSTAYSGPDSATASVSGHCTDNAGNQSGDVVFNFKYDSTAPTGVALSVTAGTPGTNGWYTSPVTIHTSGTESVATPLNCTADQSESTETTGQIFNGSCTNAAGLTTNAAPLTVKLDMTGPTATLAVSAGTLGNNGWYTSNVTISTTGNDTISNPTTCTADQSLITDTAGQTFNGSCTNDAGLKTDATALTIKRDATPPTVAITPSRSADHNGWYNQALTFTNPGTDSTSGIASCTTPAAYSGLDSSSASVSADCTDNAGNVGHGTFNFKYDATPPTSVAAAADRGPDFNDWYNHAITVTWTGTDATSGIDKCTSTPYSGPDNGSASLSGSCTDIAGNTSTSVAFNFKYDATPPTVVITPDRTADHNGWYNHGLTFTNPGTDATSGIASCTTPTAYSGPDSSTASVSADCTDNAGNVGHGTFNFKYDATPPTSVAAAADRGPDFNGWYNHAITVTWTGTDATSGIDKCTSTPYSGPDNGSASLSGSCTDVAGNTSTSVAFSFKYDATPPTLTVMFTPDTPDGMNGWWKTAGGVPYTWTCSDATSGIDNTYNGGCPTPLSGTVTANGTTPFNGQVRDQAGNLSVQVARTLKLDNVPPVIVWNSVGDSCSLPGNPPWCRGTQTAAFTASDATSGLAIAGQASFAQSTAANGTSVLIPSGTVMDAAGNVAVSINAGPYKIDNVPPTITINAPGNGQNYLLNAAVPANYSCTDATSGVATCTGTVGNGSNFSTSAVGPHSFTVNATDAAGNTATPVTNSYSVLYASGGLCDGDAGHEILQPINANGTSVFKSTSTSPAKFRVCDANGLSIGTSGVVSSFRLIGISAGTVATVDEAVTSTTPDTAFRWDPTGQQWIFNINNKSLGANNTYYFQIMLNDGSSISFDYGLR